jgi:trehalose-6-phosphate synthase/trehalose-6-phosphatase
MESSIAQPDGDASILLTSRAFADRARLLSAFSSAPSTGSPRPTGRPRRVFITSYRLPVVLEREGPGQWSAAWVEDDITAKTPNSIAGDVSTMWLGVVSRECFAPAALAALVEGGDAGAGDSAAPPTAPVDISAANRTSEGAAPGPLNGTVAGGVGDLAWSTLLPRLASMYGSADGTSPASPEVLSGLKGSGGVDVDGREMRMSPCPPLSAADIRGITAALNAMSVLPIFLPPALHEGFAAYALTVLKPAMHNVIEAGTQRVQPNAASLDFLARGWEHYSAANEAFVAVLLSQHADDDIVWWHDFWLMRAPLHFVRAHAAKASPRAVARPAQVFYVHAPFPTSEIFRTLPVRDELLLGLLQCDLVGFHSFNYARHFLHACKRLLGVPSRSRPGGELALDVDGRDVIVTISHVGVEASVLDALMASSEAEAVARRLRTMYPGKIIIAGIDSLERLSGVALKLLAFELLLEENPVYRNKVVLVQRCESALMALPADVARTSRELRERVSAINATYGPVIDYEVAHTFSPSYRMGVFHAATVLLQTPICEGLNLRPLEYVYARTKWQLERARVLDGGRDDTAPLQSATSDGGAGSSPGLPGGIGPATPKPDAPAARTLPRSPLATNSPANVGSGAALGDAMLKAVSTGMPSYYANILSVAEHASESPRQAASSGVALVSRSGQLLPPESGGCVILSEFSTASQALNSNLVVNPWSIRAVAREIDKAIAMPDPERSFRQWRDYQYAIRNPSATWSRAVLRDALGVRAEREAEAAAARGSLHTGASMGAATTRGYRSRAASSAAASGSASGAGSGSRTPVASGGGSGSRTPALGADDSSGSQTPATSTAGASIAIGGAVGRFERSCVPPLDHSAVVQAFEAANGPRLIVLDYGGTLVDRSAMLGKTEGFGNRHDFHTDGYSQTLPPAVFAAVAALAAAPNTTLFVVSGLRASAVDALQVATLDAVGLAAENGMFFSKPTPSAIASGGSGDYSGLAKAAAALQTSPTSPPLPGQSPPTRERSSVGLRGPSARALRLAPLLPLSPSGSGATSRAWASAPLRASDGAGGDHISMDEWSAIKAAALVVMCEYESRVSGSVVREYDGVALWDFRPADAEWAATQAAFLVADLKAAFAVGGAGFSASTAARDVSVALSKSRVEVALRCMNKGRFVNDLLGRLAREDEPPGFVLCIGDDTNDEEMFAVLNSDSATPLLQKNAFVFTATLGKKSATAADAYCLDVPTVHALLQRLAESTAGKAIAE